MNRTPRFPEDFPPEAVSLRRDLGVEERLAPGEPDAVLTADALYLFGLETGWRRVGLDEIAGARSRGRVIFGPWRLIAALLAMTALTAVLWLTPLAPLPRLILGIALTLVSLGVLWLRKDTDRVVYRLEVLLELGGRLALEFPERVPGRLVDRFVEAVQRQGEVSRPRASRLG